MYINFFFLSKLIKLFLLLKDNGSLYQIPQFQQMIAQILIDDSSNQQKQQIEPIFKELFETVQATQTQILSLIEVIEKIRKTYNMMLSIQKEEYVAQNVNLNLAMLDLEELLIDNDVITIEDLKNKDVDVMKLSIDFISQGEENMKIFIHHMLEFELKQNPTKQVAYKAVNLLDFDQALLGVVNAVNHIANEDQERIFSPHYQKLVQHLGTNLNADQLNIVQRANIALALAQVGSFREAKKILKTISTIDEYNVVPYLRACLYTQYTFADHNFQEMLYSNELQTEELIDCAQAFILNEIKPSNALIDEIRFRVQNIDTIEEMQPILLGLQNIQLYMRSKGDNEDFNFVRNDGAVYQSNFVQHFIQLFNRQTGNRKLNEILLNLDQIPETLRPQIYYSSNSTGQAVALAVIGSSQTSDEGVIDGQSQLRINLLQKLIPDLLVKPFAITNIFKRSQSQEYIMKEKAEFLKIIQELLNIDTRDVQLFNQIKDKLMQVQEYLKNTPEITGPFISQFDAASIMKLNLKHYTLIAFNRLNSLSNQIHDKTVANEHLKLSLIELQQRLNLYEIKIDFNQILVELSKSTTKKPKSNINKHWVGSIEALKAPNDSIEGFSVALIDSEFLLDEKYCQYEDFQKRLELVGLLRSFQQSRVVKGIEMQLVNGGEEKAIVYPHHQQVNKQAIPSYNPAWRDHAKHMNEEQRAELDQIYKFLGEEQNQSGVAPLESDWFMVNLLNLKAELKNQMKVDQLAPQLLNLDFWDKVLDERVNQESSDKVNQMLSRDASAIVNYYLSRDYQNPSTQYLQYKYDQQSGLKKLIEIRSQMLDKVAQDYQAKRINKFESENIRKSLNESLLKYIQGIKNEFSQKHTSPYFNESQIIFFQFFFKEQTYLDFQIQQQDIEKMKFKSNFPIAFDYDLMVCKGNKEQWLELKRSKCEEKMLLYRILFRLQSGQRSLTENEKKFIRQIENAKQNGFVTTLSIGDLSRKDQEFFSSFIHSNISEFKKFSLNEVIFELSQIFTEDVYLDFKDRVNQKQNDLNVDILSRKLGNQKYLIALEEKKIWEEEQRLDQQQLDRLRQILQVPKVLHSLDKSEQQKELTFQASEMSKLNQSMSPTKTMNLWLKKREEELEEKVDAYLIDETVDNFNIWKSLFHTDYDQTSKQQISEFVQLLASRLYLVKYHPPFFLRRIVKQLAIHPNLTRLDRQVLL